MAAIVNARDVLLQAAASRFSNPPNAAIILAASSPVFHIANGGAFDPASITFTASLIGLAGPVSFVATGGTLTVVGNVATLTYANMPGATATVKATLTENGQSYESNLCNITKISDGSGVTTYTWIKYGTSAAGAGLTDIPDGMTYIGLAHNKTTATESTVAADYTWSLIKGTDGVPGAAGADGQTTYTWLKYSDNADGTGLYDVPTANTLYIGLAVNKTTATESTLKTDYVWSKFKGDQGVPGASVTGPAGARGAGHFYAVGNPFTDALANGATPGENVVDDVVTVSSADGTYALEKKWNGTAWVAQGQVIDGALLVTGSVNAAKINANGLTIRTAAGAIILDAGGAGLAAGFEAPGTKNNLIAIGANGALTGAGGGAVTIGGLGYTGDLNATADINLVAQGTGLVVKGNSVTRTGGTLWDAGAHSTSAFTGGAYCSFTFDDNANAMAGLNSDSITDGANYTTLDYVWYSPANNTALHIYINNVNYNAGQNFGPRTASDVLGVALDGSNVVFTKNGVVMLTVPATGNQNLHFDSSIISGGIRNIKFGALSSTSTTLDLKYSSGMAVVGTTAKKLSGVAYGEQVYSASAYTSGAFATARIQKGSMMFGLDSAPTESANFQTLDYAFYCENGGVLQTYESNISTGVGTWAVGDTLSVVYNGSTVTYYKNGAVLRTVTTTQDRTFYFDSSFADNESSITNINFAPMTSNNWNNVGGTNKPDNNATVGAPSGTMVGGTLAQTVESNASNALANAATANAALANKLNKNADDILGGVLAVNTVTVPAGIRIGSATWNTAGDWVSGTGVAITPKGLVGYGTGGAVQFAINATTGAATFAGALSAATGSFGAVTIAVGGSISSGQTDYNVGTGFWIQGGAAPKISMKATNGASFLCDPGNNVLQFNGGTIDGTLSSTVVTNSSAGAAASTTLASPPVIAAMADVNETALLNGSNRLITTVTASMSSGEAPYTFTWVEDGQGFLNVYTGATVELRGSGNNSTISGRVTCIGRDNKARTSSTSFAYTASFGTI